MLAQTAKPLWEALQRVNSVVSIEHQHSAVTEPSTHAVPMSPGTRIESGLLFPSASFRRRLRLYPVHRPFMEEYIDYGRVEPRASAEARPHANPTPPASSFESLTKSRQSCQRNVRRVRGGRPCQGGPKCSCSRRCGLRQARGLREDKPLASKDWCLRQRAAVTA